LPATFFNPGVAVFVAQHRGGVHFFCDELAASKFVKKFTIRLTALGRMLNSTFDV
jgi:hypothetical protein